jgi:type I restriction enzyme S subunit
VFFTTSSETPLEIGYSSVLLENIDELYLNSFCFGYRMKSFKELSPQFAQYLFRSPLFRKEVIKLGQGSTRYNMSKVELMKVEILLPSESEQNKISTFLAKIDEKIKRTATQLKQAQLYQKSLLQNMFING